MIEAHAKPAADTPNKRACPGVHALLLGNCFSSPDLLALHGKVEVQKAEGVQFHCIPSLWKDWRSLQAKVEDMKGLGFDWGSIRVRDATTERPLGDDVESPIDGFSSKWEVHSVALPPEALGRMIKIKFRFVSDGVENFAVWYLDDIVVRGRSLFSGCLAPVVGGGSEETAYWSLPIRKCGAR